MSTVRDAAFDVLRRYGHEAPALAAREEPLLLDVTVTVNPDFQP
ncbi:hypothetical protein ACFLIM_28855 [Nonomuraea sp. M3C6]|uniref:Uncharacterized protein n=1 Tax=Nonomuraea marmarensis TaxID=3351344 RepID=A0ABW7AM49_9ACTN